MSFYVSFTDPSLATLPQLESAGIPVALKKKKKLVLTRLTFSPSTWRLVSLDLCFGPLNDIYCHHLTISAVEIQRVAGLRRVFVRSLHPRSPGQVTPSRSGDLLAEGGGGRHPVTPPVESHDREARTRFRGCISRLLYVNVDA